MTSDNHNVKNLETSQLVKGDHGVIMAVYVIETAGSNSTLTFRNGTTNIAPAEFHVHGHHILRLENINRRFENGIYAHITGGTGAEFLIVYK